MYRILVADEDSFYVTAIARIAERCAQKIKVVGNALSGGQAIQKAKELKPDIIVIDIKLSEINGIEVVKRIRGFDKKVHIIILTAYDYFELAKEFIELNVDGYLLKPIKNDIFFNMLQGIIKKLNDEDNEAEIERKKQSDAINILKFAEYSFIYSLLFSGDYKCLLEKHSDVLKLDSEGFIMDIEIKSQFKDKVKNVEKVLLMLYECIKNTIAKENTCAVGPFMMNRIVVYVCEKRNTDEVKQRQKILQLCDQIVMNIKDQLNIITHIGVGTIYNIDQLHISYEESIKCLRYRKEDNIESIHIADFEDKMTIVHKSYIEMERLMLESIKTSQLDSLDYFTSLLDMLKVLELEDRKNKIIELIILTCHSARLEGPNEGAFLDYIGYIEEVKEIEEIELDAWAYRKFQYLIKTIRIRKTVRVPYVIHSAIAYIEKHYTEPITLDEIANHVGLTPQYFSAYFKEEMDCNFVEYIAKLRIEKAKEIIRNSQMSVQEICFIVGYHDPNYFSRIFKKYVGCTPTKYKKEFGIL